MFDIETIVVGAGVVGLAAARALALAGHEVMVLERHDLIGSETSSRNSEVIHAGIYYPKDSLKAHCCVEGKDLLYRFCADHGVEAKRCGKLVVACSPEQVDQLKGIRQKAADNGVDDLQELSRSETLALEPHLDVESALLSPSTGIVDSHGFMLALEGGLSAKGGQVVLETEVSEIRPLPGGGFAVRTSGMDAYEVTAKNVVLSAGLEGGAVLAGLGKYRPPEMHYAKGNYFKLEGLAPFDRLIYPVPESAGLGVHLTLDLGGQAKFGPDVEWIERPDYTVDPARSDSFYAAIRKYWPDLPEDSLVADYAGVRPKLVRPGESATDFRIDGEKDHGIPGLVCLYGIESPGLTASLSLADLVAAHLGV